MKPPATLGWWSLNAAAGFSGGCIVAGNLGCVLGFALPLGVLFAGSALRPRPWRRRVFPAWCSSATFALVPTYALLSGARLLAGAPDMNTAASPFSTLLVVGSVAVAASVVLWPTWVVVSAAGNSIAARSAPRNETS